MITVIKQLCAIVIIFLYIVKATIVGIFMFLIIAVVEVITFLSDFIHDTDNYYHGVFVDYLNSVKEYIKTIWYNLT